MDVSREQSWGCDSQRGPGGEQDALALGRRPQLSLHISGVATLPLGIPAFWNYQDSALVSVD